MCGICGYLAAANRPTASEAERLLTRMSDAIAHRGPDDASHWTDERAGLGFGFRRLAIIDPSPAGRQPMVSSSGRYVLMFNGEIYNHIEVRRSLSVAAARRSRDSVANSQAQSFALPWRGHSDTEALLAGVEVWGPRGAIERSTGMFAVAIWDREREQLTLARDRMGEKPLYYGWQGGTFLFGSELKALRAHPSFAGRIDRNAVGMMLRFQCVPAPYSVYEGIHKLSPGAMVTVSASDRSALEERYWSVEHAVDTGKTHPFVGDEHDAVNQLEVLLRRVVDSQMMSDVPLGAFLSGGVDSSTVVALMQAQSSTKIRTFTIGFHEASFDEAPYAKAVAEHLGTDHTSMYVSGEATLDVIPQLPHLYDEPFSDSSQIPTFLVAKLARDAVTVSLSGDGGDEVFAGYNRYRLGARWWKIIRLIPVGVRRQVAARLTALPEERWDEALLPFARMLGRRQPVSHAGYKIRKGASVIGSQTIDEMYEGLVSHWPDPASILVGAGNGASVVPGAGAELDGLSSVERMMAFDQLTFLPDDILCKVDRAGMGVSLETRMPLLDRRVVEFAWSLPRQMKLRGGTTKWALRQVLYRYLPRNLIERPKMGFGMPIGIWLRGPLRAWAEDLLSEQRLASDGILQVAPIRRKWEEHIARRQNWEYHLWDVLMFQSWLAAQR